MWAGSSTFGVGGWEVGVRCTDADVHALLRRALAHHLVETDDSPAAANFSLHVAEDHGPRAPKGFHLLYRGVTAVVRTRDVRRLVDGVLGYLSAMAEQPDERCLRLDVLALVKDGNAILVPPDVRAALPTIERRLNAKGVRAVDRPLARVDVGTCELVVAEPELEVDWSALEGLGPSAGRPGDAAAALGRYPIVGWGFGVGPDAPGPVSRAVAVTLAAARLVDLASLDAQDALVRLVALIQAVRPTGLWSDRREDLGTALLSMFPEDDDTAGRRGPKVVQAG